MGVLSNAHSIKDGGRFIGSIYPGGFNYLILRHPGNPLHNIQVKAFERLLEGIKVLTSLLYEGRVN